jgi:hypothetical protein
VAVAPSASWLRLATAAACVLIVLAANLYVTGALELHEAPRALAVPELQALSPLLLDGQLTPDGKRFAGQLVRPAWLRLSPNERTAEASRMAAGMKRRGIDHAEILAYKAPVIQIDYGSVVFVDGGR